MVESKKPEEIYFDFSDEEIKSESMGESLDETRARLHQDRYEDRNQKDGLRHFSRAWLELKCIGRKSGACWPKGCTLPR